MSANTLAFDVYGTLINPHAIVHRLRESVGEQAADFSQLWRTKQLEYSFRRGLMGEYQDFSVVTRDALDYTDAVWGSVLTPLAKDQLMADYLVLDAYQDVPAALTSLRNKGLALFAFSNGTPDNLTTLLNHAGIDHLLDGIVSVHDVPSFKPDPRVYQHFNSRSNSLPERTSLISSNAFDIQGARFSGWHTVWVQRTRETPFDGWGDRPELIVGSLTSLADYF